MSRKKRILQALGLEDEFNELFGVRPRARSRAPRAVPSQNPLAVKLERAARQSQRALPAPPKPLALPAPGPGLPPQASKPRGGQFFTEKAYPNLSPEAVARQQASDLSYRFMDFVPEEEGVVRMGAPQANAVQDWLARSLAKYYKTDFGAPDDPLRDLAARGLHYDVDMTPERWKATVDSYLLEDPIQQILFPPNHMGGMPGAGSNMRGKTLAAMPWLAKQPVTDKLYGISGGGLDIAHFADELANALDPEASGLPADLALRPESLARMSFPQAVERVGRINQFRVKQMEDAAQALANNPAVQTFKEYPDAGYRWVELKAPDEGVGFTIEEKVDPASGTTYFTATSPITGESFPAGITRDVAVEQARQAFGRDPLQDALKYEGDTMGHCVGGYCSDVMSGRSRIFSLRDAKGQPHVTIETNPSPNMTALADYEPELADIWNYYRYSTKAPDQHLPFTEWMQKHEPDAFQKFNQPSIIQIKGKQNRAPVEDYLPYVQDFVKSGTWSNIGDLGNTGLVKLPDGRFITQQQAEEAISAIPETTTMRRAYGSNEMVPTRQVYDPSSLDYMDPEEWAAISRYFEGFAIGGRVDADRCFSRSPFGVRR